MRTGAQGRRKFGRKKMNPVYGSLGDVQGEMASICLDGWVCGSGDIWTRDGNLRHCWCVVWQAEAEWISPLHAPSARIVVQ